MPDGAAQHFEDLTQHIGGLAPAKVEGELGPILGDSGGRGALSGAIARYHIDPTDPEDPMIGLLSSIEEAIQLVGDEQIRAELGAKAASSVTQAFNSDDFELSKPYAYESVRLLAERAASFAGLAEDPKRRANAFQGISRSIIHAGGKHAGRPGSLALFEMASEYLDRSAESTVEMEEPIGSPFNLKVLAELSLDNMNNANIDPAEEDDSARELAERMKEQSVGLYKAAFAAAEQIEDDGRELYQVWTSIAVSATGYAFKVAKTDPGLQKELLGIASRSLKLVDGSNGGGHLDKLRGRRQRTYYLATMGAQILNTTANHHDESGSAAIGARAELEELEEQSMGLIMAARDIANEPYTPPDKDDYVREPASPKVIEAAQNWYWRTDDFAETKKLVETALELAIVEDKDADEFHDNNVSLAADGIFEIAEESSDPTEALELFRTVYEVEDRLADDKGEGGTFAMRSAGDRWIADLRNRRQQGEEISLTDLDGNTRVFIEFAIGNETYKPDLDVLAQVFADDDRMLQVIRDQIKSERAKERKRSGPKSQAERLARRLIRSL